MADLSKLRFNGTDYNVKDASAPLRKFTSYSKTGNLPITSDDTTQTAIGKLEKALDGKINTSAKGTASGVAELDANGKVPSSQLPSYVDDVLEYSAKSSFPSTGETGKIYVDTSTNKTYRWSGSAYVEISESLALGETSSTAYRGDRGKTAYNHSQASGNPHGTTGAGVNLTGYSKGSSTAAVAATDTVNAAIAKHENRIDANQTNILYALNKVGTNYAYDYVHGMATPTTQSGVTFAWLDNGKLSIKSDGTNTSDVYYNLELDIGSKYVGKTMSFVGGVASKCAFCISRSSSAAAISTYGADVTIPSDAVNKLFISVAANAGALDIVVEPMIRDSNITSNTYSTPALPNYDLTRLEAEDRASLAEVVDSGAKNLLALSSKTIKQDSNNVVAVIDGATNEITLNISSTTSTTCYIGLTSWTAPENGYYYLYAENATEEKILVYDDGNWATYNIPGQSKSPIAYWTKGTSRNIFLRVAENTPAVTNRKIKVMICTKAAFDVSQKFVPYRPNWDLVYQNLKDVNTVLEAVL